MNGENWRVFIRNAANEMQVLTIDGERIGLFYDRRGGLDRIRKGRITKTFMKARQQLQGSNVLST